MLECEECKHKIYSTLSAFYAERAYVKCKVIGKNNTVTLDYTTECLFFKPHCGKCGGNCGVK